MFKASDVVKYLNEIIQERGDYDVVIVMQKDAAGIAVSPLTAIGYTLEGNMITLSSYAVDIAGGTTPLNASTDTTFTIN